MSNLAEQLWKARLDGTLVDLTSVDLPANVEEAYEVQRAITDIADVQVVGFKIGATTDAAVQTLGLSEAFHGPLFHRYCKASPADVPTATAHQAIIECEIVVGLKNDLPPRDAVYQRGDVETACAWVAAGFEIVATRFDIELAGHGKLLIADSGVNMDFVMGEKKNDWSEIDLTNHPVILSVNDEQTADGHSGMSSFGDPLAAVAWLANRPTVRDRGLKAGDFITTGTCTGMVPVSIGDTVRADFGLLGEISARFIEA